MRNRNCIWLILCTGLIFGLPRICMAQTNDFEIHVKYHPVSKYVPPLDSVGKTGSSRLIETGFNSHFSLYKKIDTVNGKVKLLNGAVFGKHTALSNTGFNEQILPDDLYSISAAVSFYSVLNRKWAYTLFLNSALNSDFLSVDYNDVFLTGGLQFIRNFSPQFRLGFGVIIHNNLGKPMFWPALSVYWRFGGRFNFDIRVPDEGQGLAYSVGAGYQYNDKLRFAFAFKPQNISYDVKPGKSINNRLMNFWQLPFELSGIYTKGHFGYTANLGFSALRSFAYAEKDIKNMFTKYPYHGLRANLTFGAGIRYTF